MKKNFCSASNGATADEACQIGYASFSHLVVGSRRGNPMTFTVESEREDDGRWLAEVLELPGVLAYGQTSAEAIAKAQALAARIAKYTGLEPKDL
jgi:hypothetical protein